MGCELHDHDGNAVAEDILIGGCELRAVAYCTTNQEASLAVSKEIVLSLGL